MAQPISGQTSSPPRAASDANGVAGVHPLPAVRENPPRRAPRRRSRLWWGGGALIVALTGLALWQPWVTRPASVLIEVAAMAPTTRVLAVTGHIAALHTVDLRARVSGTLLDLTVAEGDTVAAGALLGQIDDAAQRAVLRQAIAGRDAARVGQAQARDAFARAQALGTTVARTALQAAEWAVATSNQDVERLQALVDQAQVQLDQHSLRAPFAGTVVTLLAQVGQNIDPATRLMTFADLSTLVAEIEVDEAYATQIRPGLPAVLQLSGEDRTRSGHVVQVAQRIEESTGSLAVEVAFDDPVRAPLGLSVTTNLIVERRESALTVPRTAIVDGSSVLVVEDGTARLRAVTVIDWPSARLIVTEGLTPGEAVIVDATGLNDGQRVAEGTP